MLTFSAAAIETWTAFHDHVELQCRAGEDLGPIRDFAAKAAEHAARIAGVITIVEDINAIEIGVQAMANAVTLVDWYVVETLRLHGAGRIDPRLRRAQELLDWMRTQESYVFDFRDILRLAPRPVRTKEAAEDALAVLASHGWVREVSSRPRRLRLVTG